MEAWWAYSGGSQSTMRSRRRSLRGGCQGAHRQLPKQLCRQGESKSEEMSWDGSEGENDERRKLGGMTGHRWRW